MLKIEKNVPLPDIRRGGAPKKYPFAEMEPGDSFLVRGRTEKEQQSTHHAVALANKRLWPKRFSARWVEEGTRVWRVADRTTNGAELSAGGGDPLG